MNLAIGSSNNSCASTFCGYEAFSEPEVRGVAQFIESHSDSIKCFLDFHSYGQMWMSPWAYTNNQTKDFIKQVSKIQLLSP